MYLQTLLQIFAASPINEFSMASNARLFPFSILIVRWWIVVRPGGRPPIIYSITSSCSRVFTRIFSLKSKKSIPVTVNLPTICLYRLLIISLSNCTCKEMTHKITRKQRNGLTIKTHDKNLNFPFCSNPFSLR